MPDAQALLLIAIVAVALFFDFTNGFHEPAKRAEETPSWYKRCRQFLKWLVDSNQFYLLGTTVG